MAKLLPNTDEYKMLKAFTMCLGGYYKTKKDASQEDKLRANEVFETVRESSPVNKVVMNLAVKNKGNDEAARKAIEDLDPNDPLTMYFKTVLISRMASILEFGDEIEAIALLKGCFFKDEKYIAIAAGGSTMYELSAVGVPTLCFAFVDNQEQIVDTFYQKGYVVYGGNYIKEKENFAANVAASLEELAGSEEMRRQFSEKMRRLVDGQGADRIAEALLQMYRSEQL